MSLDILRKNISSPFRLQRSVVDQGGSGGAYESGGFNPDMVYNNDEANEAVASLGKIIGAGISARTPGDENKSNIKKEARQERRSVKLESKQKEATEAGDTKRAERFKTRNTGVEARKATTTAKIKNYNESQKPSVESTLLKSLWAKNPDSTETKKETPPAAIEKIEGDNANLVDPNNTASKKDLEGFLTRLKKGQFGG